MLNRDFLIYSTISLPIVGAMALFQHIVVMGMEVSLRFYAVPAIVAFAFAYLGAKLKAHQRRQERSAWDAKLARVQRMSSLGLFASSIAHDYANVLLGIRFAHELLATEEDPQARADLVQEIERSLDQGSQLSRQILNFARGTAATRSRFDIKELLEEVQGLAQHLSSKRTVIELVGEDTETHVRADRAQLYQVILNLAVNGIQALGARSAGKLKLGYSTEPDNNKVRITVDDNGPGVPDEILGDMFSPFVTAHKTDGTGIGLYICKQIVADHQGELTYEKSELGGARFEITLDGAA